LLKKIIHRVLLGEFLLHLLLEQESINEFGNNGFIFLGQFPLLSEVFGKRKGKMNKAER